MYRLIVTAVSPANVVDILLWLQSKRLGLYKGIHTIIIATTILNNALVIIIFNIILTVILKTGNFLVVDSVSKIFMELLTD